MVTKKDVAPKVKADSIHSLINEAFGVDSTGIDLDAGVNEYIPTNKTDLPLASDNAGANANTSNGMIYVYVKHLDDSGSVVNTKHGSYLSDEVMVNVDFALGIYTTANRQTLLDIAYASGVWLTVKVSDS